ncbi:Permease of the drug/metabolite transporter (DMT) superfamily protein [Nitrospira tepida]|uniref:Permease of the drug/metabolite transporter (DMT) superfamily protein n=1 Tax=Nitrospira tepida TaxID=2973512 RepID=A0AA86MXX6_9BACT|nr:DMT family transporter [Nitrospira tepida]CAI4031096.1 Permease of the drug/metabolite transporter (DMT) superfamily protein [Nitrospira tepida]
MPQLALLATTLVWGATFPATKAALAQLPPLSFLFLRFLLGALLAVAAALALGYRLERNASVLRMGAIATIWLSLGYLCQTVGLRYTTASNSAFITVLYVVFVPIFLRRFGLLTWIAVGLALVGLLCLVKPTVSINLGDVLNLACAAAFAAHIACLEQFTRTGQSVSLFLWQMILMSLVMALGSVGESPAPEAFRPSPVLLTGLAVTGVLATGAFAVQMWAQRVVPAHQVALIFALEPACAAWLSSLFLGEQLDSLGWIGSGCILVATLLGTIWGHESGPTRATAAGAPPS